MEKKHIKRNYTLGIFNGVLMNLVDALTGSSTMLPLYLSTLTKSSVLIGLGTSFHDALWPLPQIFMAHFHEGKPFKKYVYDRTALVRVLMMFVLAFVILLNPPSVLWIFLSALFIYHVFGGIAGLSFMDVVAKTISPEKLTSFWGLRIALGGVLSIGGGFLVKFILNRYSSPFDFYLVFISAAIIVTVGLFSFCLAEEPADSTQKKTKSFIVFFKDGAKILSKDRNFKYLFFVRVLLGITAALEPFYMIYAVRELGMRPSSAGFMIAARMTGLVSSNFLWNYIARRKSVRHVLVAAGAVGIILPALAYFSFFNKATLYALFFFAGVFYSGIQVGSPSLLLIIAPHEKRPTYIGFFNTMIAPVYFVSIVHGALIDMFSFTVPFIIASLSSAAGLAAALRLRKMK
ncbi:MAG: MFS transporter [bacterium]|nr:MFS transporter [bacterium]